MSKVYNKEELQLRINDILSYLRNIIEDPEGAGVYFSDQLADIFMDVLTGKGDSGINKKFGMVTLVKNTIQFFANEEEYNIYLEDPIKNRDLLLGKVTLPSNTSTTPSIPNPNIDLSNYVTLNTDQNISGIKNFLSGIKINNSPILTYDSTTKSWLLEGNLIVTGGGAFRAALGDLNVPTIMDAILVDEQTITKDSSSGQPVLKVLKAGLDRDELIKILSEEKYATQTWVNGELTKFALKTDLPDTSTLVDLSTYQEILEVKDFKKGLKLNSSPIVTYDSTTKSFLFDGNIVVTGGGVFRATLGDLNVPTIMDAINTDEVTISKEGGILKVLKAGLDPTELEEYLEPYIKSVDVESTYATKTSVNDLSTKFDNFLTGSDTDTIINKWKELETFLSGLSESDDLATLLSNKANKATTLSGYGITDAYTKTEITTLLSGYVRLEGTAQDIKVRHNFTEGLKIGGLPIYKSQDDVLYIDSNVVISKGLTVRGTDGTTAPSIWESIPFDNTMKWDGSQWSVVGGGASVTKDSVINALGYTPLSTSGGTITGEVTITAAANSPLKINSTATDSGIYFNHNGASKTWVGFEASRGSVLYHSVGSHRLGINNDGVAFYDSNTLLHSGNYSKYALPLSGGTVNGNVRINKFLSVGAVSSSTNTARAQIHLVSSGANPCDLYFGADDTLYWSVTVRNASDAGGFNKAFALYDVTNAAYRMMMFPNGNLAIGGTTATEKLYVHGNLGLEGCLKVVKSTYPDIRGNGSHITFSPDNVNGSKGSIGLYKNSDGSYALRRVWDHYSYGVMDLGASEHRWHTIYAKSGNFSDDVTATSFIGNLTGNAATSNRLIEEVVTDLNNATPGRIFTMTSGYGSTAGNKPTEYWVTGLTLAYAQNSSFRRQLAFADAKDESLYLRAEHLGVWGEWSKILTSTNFYDYALSKDGTSSAAWKLANARYLWGQLFDGTSNIGGQMSFNAGDFILAYSATDAWTDGNGLTHPWYGIDFRAGGSYKGYISHWSGISLVSGNDITLDTNKNVVVSNGKFRINQSAFNNGLTLNRTSANAGAGIVFQSNGSLLGQIGINGTKTFEVSDGTTTKASIEITTGNLFANGALRLGQNNRTCIIENPFAAYGMTLADGNNNNPLVTVSYYNDHAYVFNYKNSNENSGIVFYDDGRAEVHVAENFRIKSKGASMSGIDIGSSDTDIWQISHRGSFANNELHFYHNANGTWSNSVLSLSANGDLVTVNNLLAKGGITARYTSDERLKTNLRPINAGNMILSLGRVREFEYIPSEINRNSLYKGRHIGLIYQDVKGSALPKMCFEREDGYGSLNYFDTSLTALLVGVAQEHEIRFSNDERELRAVKEENKALRKEIEQLKQRVV